MTSGRAFSILPFSPFSASHSYSFVDTMSFMHAYPDVRNILCGISPSPFHGIYGPPQKFINFVICFSPHPRTDQPFSCGAPTATIHQEIASGAQDGQQDSRGDQCNQSLSGIALVAPNILFIEALDPQLKGEADKWQHVTCGKGVLVRSPEHSISLMRTVRGWEEGA